MHADDTPDRPVIRQQPHGQGLAWLAAGWSCFKRRWQPLAVLSSGMLILLWLLNPKGGILFPILATLYLGTVAAYRRMDEQGEAFLAGSGVWRNPTMWALAIALTIVGAFQVALVAGIAAGTVMTGFYGGNGAHFGRGLFYAFAAAQLVLTLVLSTFWLAPALVATRGMGVLQALRLSVVGSILNPLPFLTVFVLGAILLFLASIPLGLGLVVAMPVLACAAARAAEDIVA